MFKVFVHSDLSTDLTKSKIEKIVHLCSNKGEISMITNYTDQDRALEQWFKIGDFNDVYTYGSDEYVLNNIDAIIFIFDVHRNNKVYRLAKDNHLQIRILR